MDVQETKAACHDAFAELASPACIQDPYPFMRWLQEHDPVHRAASGIFLLSRHADIYWAFKATGDAFRGPAPSELARYFPRAASSLSLNLLASTLAMKEPPTHTRLRRLISRDFTVGHIDNLRPSIARIVAARLDGMAPALERGEAVDLHREFALALPMLVFAELFGMPQDDIFELSGIVSAILEGLSPHASDPQLAAADVASARVKAYFADLILRKRADPCRDIVSTLVGAHSDDADTLSDAELISMLWGMLLGGFATTAATIDHAVLAMLAYPEERHWLQGDAAGVEAFVEEVLRCEAPAMFSSIPRIAQRDIELRGVVIPKDADVRVLIAAGNRDPDAFADPDRFDPVRFYGTRPGMSNDGKIMLSFGHGIHFCLGAQLARVQLAESLPQIQARFPTLALAEQPTREPSAFLRTFRALPVRLHAQAAAEVRVVVDQDLCGTTGQCVLTLPGAFRQREPDGVAEVCMATVPQALHAAVRLAESQCPVAAIRVIESEAGDNHCTNPGPTPSQADAERHAAKDLRNPGEHDGTI
ncbi:cytochrome P450 [Rhizobium sp. CCGE 510]|uniref:cytochrome P450 n=1 Tax=Rhizobium sp. CCGE 510 TaxID=1132836 RepID=UPI00027B855E|nr:cytochrome P450 [Rhizobium sp. CCGE 510]EJT01285.1 cytochrome P450 [Rhizobium sp. CCGE 510]